VSSLNARYGESSGPILPSAWLGTPTLAIRMPSRKHTDTN
jgi:hypothetical protein